MQADCDPTEAYNPSWDLESLFYALVFICAWYSGPEDSFKEHYSVERTVLDGWCDSCLEYPALAELKLESIKNAGLRSASDAPTEGADMTTVINQRRARQMKSLKIKREKGVSERGPGSLAGDSSTDLSPSLTARQGLLRCFHFLCNAPLR